jgi:hypothetical protein
MACLIEIHHHVGRSIYQDPVKAVKVPIIGHSVRFYTFRFERDSDSRLRTGKPGHEMTNGVNRATFPCFNKDTVTDVGI